MEDSKFIQLGKITVSMTHCCKDLFFDVCEHSCIVDGKKSRYVSSPVIIDYCIKNGINIPNHFKSRRSKL